VEEKYKNQPDDDDESSSTDETEDEDGFLATEDLDAQISATLNAIRSKDPRVYDKDVTFFQGEKDGEGTGKPKEKVAKPVTLRDYQREKLLRGDIGASDDEADEAPPQTYAEEQAALKKSIVSEIHAAGDAGDSDSESDDGFMKRKESAAPAPQVEGVHASRSAKIKVAKVVNIDVENADKDPENFLSNFLAARAWVPEEGGKWKAFESDDGSGSDNDQAEEFEQAYNLRFEDPAKSNEVLKSYSRDITNARSVRREEKTGRAKQRELEREKKEAEKRVRQEEKARLKKLKLEETAEKLKKVKRAAGKSGVELSDEDWMKFLDDAWDDDKWEEAMNKRFGDDYYAQKEIEEEEDSEDEEDGARKKKRKAPKKPTWDDDIDIKDIIPDFEDDTKTPAVTLSDAEEEAQEDTDDEDGAPSSKKRKTSTDHKKARLEAQRKSRQERSKLEALVESKLEQTNHPLLSSQPSSSSALPAFRYRETSPESFGMTARDILLAPSDKHLNEYAGLKKLATFRDEEKKRKDKKRLGKKARLRQWRRDVFGREFEREGPTYGFEKFAGEEEVKGDDGGDGDQEKKKKKRKRSKGKKKADAEGDVDMDAEAGDD
jgi:protein KRI1